MKKEHDLKIPAKLKLDLLNVKFEAVIPGWDEAQCGRYLLMFQRNVSSVSMNYQSINQST